MMYYTVTSDTAQQFQSQVRHIFSCTAQGAPTTADRLFDRVDESIVHFFGNWLPRGGYSIGTITTEYVGNGAISIEVYDDTFDHKLSRLVWRIVGVSSRVKLWSAPKASAERLFVKEMLSDFLAIENHSRNRRGRGISKFEWRQLHKEAVRVGAFDIAEIAFKYLLIAAVGWEKTKSIIDEHWATYLKTTANTVDNGSEEDGYES